MNTQEDLIGPTLGPVAIPAIPAENDCFHFPKLTKTLWIEAGILTIEKHYKGEETGKEEHKV